MKDQKRLLFIILLLSILSLLACTKNSEENINNKKEASQGQKEEATGDTIQETKELTSPGVKDNTKNNQDPEEVEETNSTKENMGDDSQIDSDTKIKGRQEYIERLNQVQKELDSLEIKKDSDKGVTNAMRSFYGISYEEYDKVLNEIYNLYKEELSKETMKELQEEQLNWIEEKEKRAIKELEEYKGGTFEFVAYNLSLYESTKERCYELVNTYMED